MLQKAAIGAGNQLLKQRSVEMAPTLDPISARQPAAAQTNRQQQVERLGPRTGTLTSVQAPKQPRKRKPDLSQHTANRGPAAKLARQPSAEQVSSPPTGQPVPVKATTSADTDIPGMSRPLKGFKIPKLTSSVDESTMPATAQQLRMRDEEKMWGDMRCRVRMHGFQFTEQMAIRIGSSRPGTARSTANVTVCEAGKAAVVVGGRQPDTGGATHGQHNVRHGTTASIATRPTAGTQVRPTLRNYDPPPR
jgi:hypothetical protein